MCKQLLSSRPPCTAKVAGRWPKYWLKRWSFPLRNCCSYSTEHTCFGWCLSKNARWLQQKPTSQSRWTLLHRSRHVSSPSAANRPLSVTVAINNFRPRGCSKHACELYFLLLFLTFATAGIVYTNEECQRRGNWVWTTCPQSLHSRARPGIELATFWSQVRRPTIAPPRPIFTKFHQISSTRANCDSDSRPMTRPSRGGVATRRVLRRRRISSMTSCCAKDPHRLYATASCRKGRILVPCVRCGLTSWTTLMSRSTTSLSITLWSQSASLSRAIHMPAATLW